MNVATHASHLSNSASIFIDWIDMAVNSWRIPKEEMKKQQRHRMMDDSA
jgi:hypothetical protein